MPRKRRRAAAVEQYAAVRRLSKVKASNATTLAKASDDVGEWRGRAASSEQQFYDTPVHRVSCVMRALSVT